MAVRFAEPCEGTNGTTTTTDNTEFDVFNAVGARPAFSTAQKLFGNSSIDVSCSGQARYCTYDAGSLSAVWGVRYYFRMGGFPGANGTTFQALNGATIRAQHQILTDGTFRLRRATTSAYATPSPLAINTWYRAESWFSTSQFRLGLYLGDSPTALYDSGVQTYGAGTFNRVQFGNSTNTTWSGLYLDQVTATDTSAFPGPSATPIGITTPADFSMLAGDSYPIAMTKSDGSGTVTYLWTVQSGPNLSNSQFGNRNVASTNFIPTLAGSYVLLGQGTDDTGSDSDTTTATVGSPDRMRFSRAVVIQG